MEFVDESRVGHVVGSSTPVKVLEEVRCGHRH